MPAEFERKITKYILIDIVIRWLITEKFL